MTCIWVLCSFLRFYARYCDRIYLCSRICRQGSFKEFDWYEELFDYGNQLGVKAGCIGGLKKSVYNGVDFGTITVSSYAVAH